MIYCTYSKESGRSVLYTLLKCSTHRVCWLADISHVYFVESMFFRLVEIVDGIPARILFALCGVRMCVVVLLIVMSFSPLLCLWYMTRRHSTYNNGHGYLHCIVCLTYTQQLLNKRKLISTAFTVDTAVDCVVTTTCKMKAQHSGDTV